MSPYTVYGSVRSRALRVLWALEELGQPYAVVHAPPRSEAVCALNPSGKIPVMTVDGVTLTVPRRSPRRPDPSRGLARARAPGRRDPVRLRRGRRPALVGGEASLRPARGRARARRQGGRRRRVRPCDDDAGTPPRRRQLRRGRGLHRARPDPRPLHRLGGRRRFRRAAAPRRRLLRALARPPCPRPRRRPRRSRSGVNTDRRRHALTRQYQCLSSSHAWEWRALGVHSRGPLNRARSLRRTSSGSSASAPPSSRSRRRSPWI